MPASVHVRCRSAGAQRRTHALARTGAQDTNSLLHIKELGHVDRRMKQKHSPPRVIAIDVDGTLQCGGRANEVLIAWCRLRRQDGFSLILWSSRGESYARAVAKAFECAEIFDHIVSKPGYVVDDHGWEWIRWTRVLRPDEMEIESDAGSSPSWVLPEGG